MARSRRRAWCQAKKEKGPAVWKDGRTAILPVGRALAGWREMPLPAMQELRGDLAVWPFDGALQSWL